MCAEDWAGTVVTTESLGDEKVMFDITGTVKEFRVVEDIVDAVIDADIPCIEEDILTTGIGRRMLTDDMAFEEKPSAVEYESWLTGKEEPFLCTEEIFLATAEGELCCVHGGQLNAVVSGEVPVIVEDLLRAAAVRELKTGEMLVGKALGLRLCIETLFVVIEASHPRMDDARGADVVTVLESFLSVPVEKVCVDVDSDRLAFAADGAMDADVTEDIDLDEMPLGEAEKGGWPSEPLIAAGKAVTEAE
ncbi:hypothetical protein H2203_005974 [Taxawa tesnikishii (nom. ined.)]|nr:hypothetical protein H2203_005974 [Dothideales sp. JES 119]